MVIAKVVHFFKTGKEKPVTPLLLRWASALGNGFSRCAVVKQLSLDVNDVTYLYLGTVLKGNPLFVFVKGFYGAGVSGVLSALLVWVGQSGQC